MSNEIDLVVGSAVKTQLDTLMKELVKIDEQIQKIGETAADMNTKLGVKDTASLTKLTAENEKLNKKIQELTGSSTILETKLANLSAAQARATKAATDAAIAEEKLITATNKNTVVVEKKTKAITEDTIAQREANKQATINATINNEQVGAYKRLEAQYQKTAQKALDLGAANKQNTEEYKRLVKESQELGQRLKSVDSDVGKHTRNVGNYASSWNGLGNSINQLTREAPAFANSVQTGFMALSNNIPILTDELGVLIAKNKALQADGKPTESILKTVAGAFFSLQTAISLGVTILTVYGAKIWEMITAGDKAAESQKKLNDELSNVKNTVTTQMTQISSLVDIVNSSTESEKNRQLAYDEIKKTLPGLTSATYNQAIATGELKNATDLYVLSLIQQQLVETQVKSISDEQTKLNEKKSLSYKEYIGKVESWLQSLQPERIQKNLKKSLTTQRELEEGNQQAIIDNRRKGLVKLQEDFLKTQKALKTFVTPPKEEETGKDKTEDVERKAIKSVNELEKVDTLLGRINTEIERLKVEKIEANAEELPAVNFQLEMLYKLRSQLNELPVGGALPDNFVKPEQIEGVKQLTKEMQSYLNSFGAEFASKAGLSETFNMLSGNIEGFGENAAVTFVAVAESAQEMFNIIAESSQANFDAEYARLDKQKTEALKFAGDSTAAKEKIDTDYEKKKKEIQLREFKAKQKITIANIAIDTAQAIVSTYAQVPKYDFGVSATTLAFIIAGLGAAQIAMVATQKPPAYADGTDNHSGGLMLVNDGAGSNYQEKVVLPSGKVIRPQGRNVLMNAPKGTKVLNHEQQLFEMLQSNNISMSSQQPSGLTYDEMNEIFKQNLSNIKTQNTIFDKNGFQSYVKNGNSITRSNSNRSQAIGISV